MKKVFSILFLLSLSHFQGEASTSTPYEELQKHPNLNKSQIVETVKEKKDLERVKRSFQNYCDRYIILPNVHTLDPDEEDGIWQILQDVKDIRKKDSTGNILIFLDIDQFTFWKDGFTPTVHLSQEKIDNYYRREDHTNLFRDPEFPKIMGKFKKLGCIVYGLTSRYSSYSNYTDEVFSRIKDNCYKLQQLIKFHSFPENFKYTDIEKKYNNLSDFIDFSSFSQNEYAPFFLKNLSEEKNVFSPLFGSSGIFLTGEKLKAIDYLLKEGETLGLFSPAQKPSHIIFGDDWGDNLMGDIPDNVKCYHWPYPYSIKDKFLPYMELHKDGQEAFTHFLYTAGSETTLKEFIVSKLSTSFEENKEEFSNCLKAILNEFILREKKAFLYFMGEGHSNEIMAILNYLKWENLEHKKIQAYLLEDVLRGCLSEFAKNIYESKVQEFFKNLQIEDSMNTISNNIIENSYDLPQLGDSPTQLRRSPPNKNKLYDPLSKFLKHEIIKKDYKMKKNDFEYDIIPKNKKIKIIGNIVDQFIGWYLFSKKN